MRKHVLVTGATCPPPGLVVPFLQIVNEKGRFQVAYL